MRLDADIKTIGTIIREKRLEKGLTQQGLVFEMNVLMRKQKPKKQRLISLDWLRQIERGDPRTISTERLGYAAEVLGIPVSQLLPVMTSTGTNSDVTEVILALRGYGVSEQSVEKILQYIQDEKEHEEKSTGDLGGPIPKPPAESET